MRIKKIVKMFKEQNISVFGLRGTGKDILFGNVIARRKKETYTSNLNYGFNYFELNLNYLNVNNTYDNLINHNINYYSYNDFYPYGTDIYISDAGVYFPSQYNNELNKKFPYIPVFAALSRQVAHANFHYNSQYLGRVWDKLREQSNLYILCIKCKFIKFSKIFKRFKNLVYMKIIIYDKYESALNLVKPCRISTSLFDKNISKTQIKIYKDNFYNQHGNINKYKLLFFNKSKHDTLYFDKLFKDGKKISVYSKDYVNNSVHIKG